MNSFNKAHNKGNKPLQVTHEAFLASFEAISIFFLICKTVTIFYLLSLRSEPDPGSEIRKKLDPIRDPRSERKSWIRTSLLWGEYRVRQARGIIHFEACLKVVFILLQRQCIHQNHPKKILCQFKTRIFLFKRQKY